MHTIDTENAPSAIGPYSQAIVVGNQLFVSRQSPIDPSTGDLAALDGVGQMRQCLDNIRAIAEAAGTDIARTVKTTILLTDLSIFAEMNEEYDKAFQAPFPTRACYKISTLPKGALVEVEAVIAI